MKSITVHNLDDPLPINDVWIAAHAAETGATLVVSYANHFEKIIGLKIWQPRTA